MPFLDTNSHLTTRPYNFDIKCQGNSESFDRHRFFGTKFRGGQNFLITVGGFHNEREYSGADWPVLLVSTFFWAEIGLEGSPSCKKEKTCQIFLDKAKFLIHLMTLKKYKFF